MVSRFIVLPGTGRLTVKPSPSASPRSFAAPVPGFVGFAVGRSIWEDPLAGYLQDGQDRFLVEAVRENYLHFARMYLDAR